MNWEDILVRVFIGLLVILLLVGGYVRERRDWQTHRAIQKMAETK